MHRFFTLKVAGTVDFNAWSRIAYANYSIASYYYKGTTTLFSF